MTLALAELLGQDELADAIIKRLDVPETRAVRVSGPPGSGKTTVALLAAGLWQERGGRCVIATGDDSHSHRPLYPLLSGLSVLPTDWRVLATQGSRSTLQAVDSLARTGGAGLSVFDLLTSAFRQRVDRALLAFSATERDIIHDLRRVARGRRLLVVADNCHWWDAESLLLLAEVMSARLRDAIPQLESVQLLLVDTAPDQAPSSPGAFRALTSVCAEPTVRLERCARAQFGNVLGSLGIETHLPEEIIDELYVATGGHLKLAEQLVEYSRTNDLRRSLEASDVRYFRRLLDSRVDSIGAEGAEVAGLLANAAVIGLSFSERELICLASSNDQSIDRVVERAEQMRLVTRVGDRISFSHDVVRSAFLDGAAPSDMRAQRGRFEKCLSSLRPGDYIARADLLLQAGDLERGRELVAIAAIDQMRRAVPSERVMTAATAQLPNDPGLRDFLVRVTSAYDAIEAGQYQTALPLLRVSGASESSLMAAERNYLLALCHLEGESRAGALEAQRILESWQQTVRTEAEMAIRFLLLLQQAQLFADDFDAARSTERTIEQRLRRRVAYDPHARVMLQIQNRRSAGVDSSEIAEIRIREAIAFFQAGSGDPTRDRVELFRALNNLTAVQLQLGRADDAWETGELCQAVAYDSADAIPRLDVLANNIVIASLRSGRFDVETAVARQRAVVDSPEGGDDKFLHRCNLASLLLLAERDAEAAVELEALGRRLFDRETGETYLLFYWRAMDVIATALRGDVETAYVKHHRMTPFVEGLRWPEAAYVRRRHELIEPLLGDLTTARRDEVDTAVLTVNPVEIGPSWSELSRVFLLSDLSFWLDS